VNRAVSVNAGGTITAGDGTGGSLTVSNLTFTGTDTINVGDLPDYTGAAAIIVSNALTVSGGAGAVTVNLPTAPGFNGTYHLIQFGSGPANTNGFKLGTVPTLAWNQTGALQVSGNYLDYVITAFGDTIPPTLKRTLPANNATDAPTNVAIVATFDETIVPGVGSIELRRSSNSNLVESFNVASSPRLTFSTTQLTIQPSAALATNRQDYVVIPFGALKDTSGNNFAGLTNVTSWRFTVAPPVVLYTDTGSPTNPPWSVIYPTLNVESPDPGPVYGSLIDVNNTAVEVGLYSNRPILVPSQRIHVACYTSTANFANFTRWFQTDGNTHVLRVFVDDHNTANDRTNSLHNEAFMAGGRNYTNDATYEWTSHYTIAYLRQGYCAFQLKNSDNDWAVQLGMSGSGVLTVNNRSGTDVTVTNADGSAKNFKGGGFDVRVLDDGLNYKVWIDGFLYASKSYSRPTGTTTFCWGMYYGENNLNPPADYELVLVSGAQIKSWPGNLSTATTAINKANNTTSLHTGFSWVGGVTPGLYEQAVWDATVTGTNTTTLASYQQWAGLKILNPGGPVTINGSSILGLDDAGVDLTAATQNLDVNCPVQLTAASAWSVAPGRTATFDGIISGFPGFTFTGGGTLSLSAANTYTGATIVNAGKLALGNTSALLTASSLTLADGTTLQPNLDGVIISAPITVGGSGTTATISAPINAPGALSRTSSKPAPRAGRCC
jgi:autotransporter-associated beta strand protein